MAAADCRSNCRDCRFTIASGKFAGYRGFGVCRDLDGTDAAGRVAPLRILQSPRRRRRRFRRYPPARTMPAARPPRICPKYPASHRPLRLNCQRRLPPRLHTRPIWKRPWKRPTKHSRTSCRFARSANRRRRSLTPVENSAFNELARQLSARLDSENGAVAAPDLSDAAGSMPSSRPAAAARSTGRNAGLAGAARAAGARRDPARQGAARPVAGRRADLPARPAALRQPARSSRGSATTACTRSKRPAVSTRSMSNPASPPPAAPPRPARR